MCVCEMQEEGGRVGGGVGEVEGQIDQLQLAIHLIASACPPPTARHASLHFGPKSRF